MTEAIYVAADRSRRQQTGLDAAEPRAANGVHLLAIILGHHGEPPDFQARAPFGPFWAPTLERNPITAVRTLIDTARHGWPAAFEPGGLLLPNLLKPAPFWHAFLGLLQLADRLGSDSAPDAFPFSEAGAPSRLDLSRVRAGDLVERLGLDPRKMRHLLPAVFDFSAIGPYPPSPLQLAVAELAGPIVGLEAETGSGKTEAAFRRFAHPFADSMVDGLYFALPTRGAAIAKHARIQAACDRLLGKGSWTWCALCPVMSLPVRPAAPAAGLRRPMDGRPRRGHKALPLGRREAEALSRRASGVGHH